MLYYQSYVCRNGNIKTCSKIGGSGRNANGEITYGGGWKCAKLCRFNSNQEMEEFKKECLQKYGNDDLMFVLGKKSEQDRKDDHKL